MPDTMTKQQRHDCMSHIRSKDTQPELRLRRGLHARGYRFRVNVRDLPGSPDLVLAKYRTCIFVNGCFWHGHAGCPKFVMPGSNVEFWQQKIERNRERDLRDYGLLESLGWRVIVVWECELSRSAIDATVASVGERLGENLLALEEYRERRRRDRAFAVAECRRRRAVRAAFEAELRQQFDIPGRIVRMSRDVGEDQA